MNADAISEYTSSLDPARAAVCNALQGHITAGLPQATSKIWHGSPVWFIGANPVVGYDARKEGVVLLFWNGQRFEEPELEAMGTFHAAQVRYDDVAKIDAAKLAGWLAKAGTNIWDGVTELAALRAAAKKKKSAPKKAKAKAKAKPSAKRAKAVKKPARKSKRKAAPKKVKKSRARKK